MRSAIYQTFNAITQKFVGPMYRKFGKQLYVYGTKLQGENASQDRLVPSLRNVAYGGAQPDLQAADFIAPNATILGKVSIGLNSSIWYGATVIGTQGVKIGDNSIIQDRVHISRNTQIGDNVFVGPNSTLQGAQLNDGAFVAMGATVRHATVQTGGFVAAGGVIPDGIVVKQGQIWAGNPGKFLRHLNTTQRQVLRQHLQQMKDLALVHSQQAQKNSRQVISQKKQPFQSAVFDDYIKNLYNHQFNGQIALSAKDQQFLQRRTMMREPIQALDLNPDYQPYQYNISHMGQKFNLGVHQQDYMRVATKVYKKQKFDTDNNPWTKAF